MARIKKCKQCGNSFEVLRPLQYLCSPQCAIKYVSKKESDNRVKQMKKGLRTHKDYLQILQKVFNEFIRLRDKGKLCICCDKPLGNKYHSGHFFSVGAHPALRFDEDNAHGQREDCNLHKHGNTANYSNRLPKRIGWERYESLFEKSNKPLKLSITEIQELIVKYKTKIKELNG